MKKIAGCIGMILFVLVVMAGARLAYHGAVTTSGQPVEKTASEKVINWKKPDLESMEFYGLELFETSLPVLFIDTKEQRITKENKIWASLAVLEAGEGGRMRSVLETPDYSTAVTIKYRGASSYSNFDKKQYRIKFYKKEGSTNAKNYNFLGMGSHSEWVLNGPFLDKTLMRNRMVYQLGKEIMPWAPDTRFTEVFLDGIYQGVYLAAEPVTNGESRLRLSEFGLLSGETSYIVKRDRIGTEEDPLEVYGRVQGKTSNELYIEYPSSGRLTRLQRDWIVKDISEFEEVLYSDNFADPEIGYAKYIDVDNFVDYVILNEVVMNNDAGDLSTYIYKELGGKLQTAVWDFNNCYDNYQWFSQDFTSFFTLNRSWFSRLLTDRAFVDRLVERYKELRQGSLAEAHMYQLIDAGQEELGDAVERNFAVWGYTFDVSLLSNMGAEINRNPSNYEEAIEMLKNAIAKRFAFLDEHITDLYQYCIN